MILFAQISILALLGICAVALILINEDDANKHMCNFHVTDRSNTIQYDDMGYPLRLCIHKCVSCGKQEQVWIDTEEQDGDVVLKWIK